MSRKRSKSVSSTEVTLRLPTESVRRLKGLEQYQERGASVGPLGNREQWKQALARAAIRRMAQDFDDVDESAFSVAGDGSIVNKGD